MSRTLGQPVQDGTIKTFDDVVNFTLNSQFHCLNMSDPAVVVWEFVANNWDKNVPLNFKDDYTEYYKRVLKSGDSKEISVAMCHATLDNLIYQYALYNGFCHAHYSNYRTVNTEHWSRLLADKLRVMKKRPVEVRVLH